MSEDLNKILDDFKKMNEEFMTKLQSSFENVVSEMFRRNKNLGVISWNQYTPYFNDGEECIFGIGDIYAATNEALKDDEYYDEMSAYEFDDVLSEYAIKEPSSWAFEGFKKDGPSSYYAEEIAQWNALSDEDKELTRLTEKFVSTLATLPDDVYKAMFGDHVTVKIVRDEKSPTGVRSIVSEFDHE